MPLTMGFIGKFLIVTAGGGAALWALVVVLVLSSTIGLYYYTRLIVAMYVRRPEELEPAGAGPAARLATAGGAASIAVMGALTVVLVVFGVYPSPLHPARGTRRLGAPLAVSRARRGAPPRAPRGSPAATAW